MIRIALFVLILLGIYFTLYLTFNLINSKKDLSQLNIPYISEKLALVKPKVKEVVTIDKIFLEKGKREATPTGKNIRTLIATGDIIPARSVNFGAYQRDNFKWPFLNTSDFLKQADITFINLETPIIKDCPLTQVGMIFCGDSRHVEGLLLSGVDVASLANNHAGNQGIKGVEETVELLKNNNIQITGTLKQNLSVIDVRGLKFGFLGFDDIDSNQPGISMLDEEKIANEIREAKKQVDVVVVAFHWGIEYVSQPNDRQKNIAHLTIDSGADLVIGNHPHWIQPVEIYKEKLITYAHGNFVFDQMWSQKTKEGVVGKYTFDGKDLIDVEFFPVEIIDYGQPYFLKGEKEEKILNEMKDESIKLRDSYLP